MASARVERVGNRRRRTRSTPLRARPASAGEAARATNRGGGSLAPALADGSWVIEFLAERPPSMNTSASSASAGDRFGRGRASAARAGPHGRDARPRGSPSSATSESWRPRARSASIRASSAVNRKLLQTRDLGLGEGLEGEVREVRVRAPGASRASRSVSEARSASPLASSRRPCSQPGLEPTDVEPLWRNTRHVARRLGEQELVAGSVGEQSPELREIDVQDQLTVRGAVSPQSSSISRSRATGSFACRRRRPRSARCFGLPSGSTRCLGRPRAARGSELRDRMPS